MGKMLRALTEKTQITCLLVGGIVQGTSKQDT
jgi:hypothetical protein